MYTPNYLVLKKKARTLALRRKTQTIYVPVDNNIYFDGLSYRVRVTRNGIRTSKNFKTKNHALNFRKKLTS
jgi:hypothetical protein